MEQNRVPVPPHSTAGNLALAAPAVRPKQQEPSPRRGAREANAPAHAAAPRRELSARGRKAAGLLALAVFLLFCGGMFWFVGRPMLAYLSQPERFRGWVNGHGFLGRVAMVGMSVLQIVVALIPGEVIEIGAGYAFGFWEGTLLCIIGAVIGGVLVFGLVRTFGVKLLEAFFPVDKIHALSFMQNSRRLNLLVFILFFIPGTPKDILAYFVGLTPMRLPVWIFISAVARIPSIITSTMVGDALGTQDYRFALVVFLATLALSVVGVMVYRRTCRLDKNAADTNKK